MLEFGGGLALVAEPGLEGGVPGVARFKDLHRDRRPIPLAAHEYPGDPSLAYQALEEVGAKGLAHEIGGRVGHVSGLYKRDTVRLT